MNTLGTVRDLPHGIFGGVKHHLFLIDCCVRRDQLADLFLCSLFSSPLGIGNRLQNLPHSALTRAAETTLSPSSSFMILTPWVFLPITPTPEIGMRMIDPCCETTITSSLSDTHLMATTAPFLSFETMSITPEPPREMSRYSETGVLFPYPFSVIVSRNLSGSALTIPITRSFAFNLMPLTPFPDLPTVLISSS